MLASILSWIGGGGLSSITKALQQAYEAKLRAQTDGEKLKADVAIRELEAQRSVILAAQSDKVERWVRVGFALPFIVYNAKLVLWDKVLGLGVTDPLSADLAQIQMVVLGGYFFFFTAKAIRK
ncbi:MAG: hypothetical protein WBA88_23970 [Pseudaminobacter sp.]